MGELREADVHARQPPDRGRSPDDYGECSGRYETRTALAAAAAAAAPNSLFTVQVYLFHYVLLVF